MKNSFFKLISQNGRTIRKIIIFLVPMIISFYYFHMFLMSGMYETKPENMSEFSYKIVYIMGALYMIFLIVLVSLVLIFLIRLFLIVSYISFIEWRKPNIVIKEFIKKELKI